MHRFYCPNIDLSKRIVQITEKNELHHIKDVLRLRKDANVVIFDGKSVEANTKIVSIGPICANLEILSFKEHKQKIPAIILACAIPKKTTFELIIEKATELGVDEIIPLKTQRTEVCFKDSNKRNDKILRFEKIAINAAKQSQRVTIPKIHPITDFSSALKNLINSSNVIIPSLIGERKNLLTALKEIKTPKRVSFLIGPEGDFTEEEYHQAHSAGCVAVTLCDTILKVETAALSVLACANLFYANK